VARPYQGPAAADAQPGTLVPCGRSVGAVGKDGGTSGGTDGSGRAATGEEPVVRLATPADAEPLARCQVACWREAYGPLAPPGFFDRYGDGEGRLDFWRRALVVPYVRAVVAVDPADDPRDAAVGLATVGPADAVTDQDPDPPDPTIVHAVYVRRRVYGTGVADRLLELALGDRPAHLWVLADNPRAHAFYVRHGFVADGARRQDDWLDRTVVRMTRPAPGSLPRG
jgi:GNAT superfamily N-acetyltransferase